MCGTLILKFCLDRVHKELVQIVHLQMKEKKERMPSNLDMSPLETHFH